MSDTLDDVRTQLAAQLSGAPGLLTALEQVLGETESTEYSLPSDRNLVCDDETVMQIANDGTGVVVATDRRLLFGFETPTSAETRGVPYTDLRDIRAADSLFRSTLVVDVWAEGVYEFTPSDAGSMDELASFVDEVSGDWQRVVATLEDCHELTAQLCADLAAGRGQAARNRGDELERTLAKATARAERADERIRDALDERIRVAEADCHREWTDGRIERAETLIAEAARQAETNAYAEAYRRYERARAHLERALTADIEYGFERTRTIQTKIDTVDARLSDLSVRPMAMAHQARERAMATDKHAVAVEHWQDAFEQYRRALTAGWGTDIDFADTEQLRERIEETVVDLIDARRAYAEALEATGDRDLDSEGDTESARDRYRQARDQVDDALGLAREFRSGDLDSLHAFRDRLDEKLTQIGDDA
ncbi:hypothetical protein [Halovenus marina]|uniref:hypothetical protein n=1 Tax=Halovenus marina TaxID=3396621 RepID=UPI003F547B3C